MIGRDFDFGVEPAPAGGARPATRRRAAAAVFRRRRAVRQRGRMRRSRRQPRDRAACRDAALAAGHPHAYLRGRFERATLDGVEWVFDVAHNPAAAAVFAASIARLPPARAPSPCSQRCATRISPASSRRSCRRRRWFVTQANAERGATPARARDALATARRAAVVDAPRT